MTAMLLPTTVCLQQSSSSGNDVCLKGRQTVPGPLVARRVLWSQTQTLINDSTYDVCRLCQADIESSVTVDIGGDALPAAGVHAAHDVARMIILRKLAAPEKLVDVVMSYLIEHY